MSRRTLWLIVLLVSCKPVRTERPATASTALPIASVSAAAPPLMPPVDPVAPKMTEAEKALEEIRRAAKACDADKRAPECETGRSLAAEYLLMHCGEDGIDPAYTFAWAAEVPMPGATPFKDEFGRTFYVDAERSPKLARVDERIWSESGWFSAEPNLRFTTEYPTAEEAKRLTVLDEQIRKKTQAEGIVRAVFYEKKFIGAYPFYTKLEPQLDGGMLYGWLATTPAHPLCKTREKRVLPDDLVDFAGTWARLR